MKHRFSPPWQMTLAVIVLLPLMCSLGFWQLDRAEQKREWLNAYLDVLAGPAHAPETLGEDEFRRVRLAGEFGSSQFLVDNQIQDGVVGYAVVQAFATASARYLINRGFVPGGSDREVLPDVPSPRGNVTITALAWPQTGLVPLLDGDAWPEGDRIRVQRMDLTQMAARIGGLPVELRLEAGQPGALAVAPVTGVLAGLSPDKHTGYAVQWFCMCVALLLCYAWLGFRKT